MFKKGAKLIISLSFIAIVFGAVFFGIGLMTGGLQEFKEKTQPQLAVQTFDQAKSIALALNTREVHIEPSPDNKVHVAYYNLQNDTPVKAQLTQDKTLQVSQQHGRANWQILSFIGHELHLPTSKDYGIVTIQLPKGQTLERVYGRVEGRLAFTPEENIEDIFDIKISQQVIQDIDLTGNVKLDQVSIDKGKLAISSASNPITKSQLKNLTITGWDILDDETDDDYLPTNLVPNYNVTLDDTSLENVTFEDGLVNLTGQAVSLKGDIDMRSRYAQIQLGLTADSLKNTSFQLSHSPEEDNEVPNWEEVVDEGEAGKQEQAQFAIQLPESIRKEAQTLSETKAVRELKKPSAKLTINNSGWGSIAIK